MKRIKLLGQALFLLCAITSCKKDGANPDPSTGNPGNGMLKGTVYSPNGEVPLGAVIVEALVNGNRKADTTDKEGKFELELPAGEHHLKMYAGAGDKFSAKKSFLVQAGETQNIPATQTKLNFTGKIAYVEGDFDAIQVLLTEMGIPATGLTLDDMRDYNIIKQFDVLLLNCSSGYIDFEDDKLLDRYLQEGHSIYASDFEMRALSKQDMGFIPENLITYDYLGDVGIIEGRILFEPFKKALGKNSISIEFDLPMYVQITKLATADPRFKVLVDHPQKGPLALSIQWGQSRMSSQGIAYGGNIIYTTFHDAALSSDVKAVLRQMILQL